MKELLKKIAISGSGLALLAGVSFADVGNTDTGENSLNDVNVESENEVDVDVDNDAYVKNILDVIANTGLNAIVGEKDHNGHGGHGGCESSINGNHDNCDDDCDECDNDDNGVAGNREIMTGDADASAEVTNRVNRTTVNAEMPSSSLGDIGNDGTGMNSENSVCVEEENEVDIDVDNDATVKNYVDVIANTGKNFISTSGRGNATITTGDATASASIVNEVNTTSVTVE